MYWGTIEESRGGKRILSFRGIQYAQQPVGKLRWKSPQTNLPEWKVVQFTLFFHELNSPYNAIQFMKYRYFYVHLSF